MTTQDVTGPVKVKEPDEAGSGVTLYRDHGHLALTAAAAMLSPAEWEALKAEGDRLLAGVSCRCILGGGELLPLACPVHGTPCEVCGGLESCEDGCGTRPPRVPDEGDWAEVGCMDDRGGEGIYADEHEGVVRLVFPLPEGQAVRHLDTAGQEEFAQLYVAACHQAQQGAAAAPAGAEGAYKVEGKDGFGPEADYYPIGEWPSCDAALEAARDSLAELDLCQPDAGGQAGIQDRVYVVHPDGHRERVLS